MAEEVRFNEEPTGYAAYGAPPKSPGILGFVRSMGLAKTDAGAEKLLLALAVGAAILAIGLFLFLRPPAGHGKDVPVGKPVIGRVRTAS